MAKKNLQTQTVALEELEFSETLTNDLSENIATNLINSLFDKDISPINKTYNKLDFCVAIYSIQDLSKFGDLKSQVSKAKSGINSEYKNVQDAINNADGERGHNKDILVWLTNTQNRKKELQESMANINSALQANGYTQEDFLGK